MAGINRNFDSNVSHLDSHFNVSLIWKLGETFVWLPEFVEPMRLLALAGAYFFALPSSGLWLRSSFPKGRFFCTTRNCAA